MVYYPPGIYPWNPPPVDEEEEPGPGQRITPSDPGYVPPPPGPKPEKHPGGWGYQPPMFPEPAPSEGAPAPEPTTPFFGSRQDAGGGGGYGGGGSQITPLNPALYTLEDNFSNMIKDTLAKIISGEMTTFSPDVVTSMKASAKSATEGGARSAADALRYQLQRQGMYDSPAGAHGLIDIQTQKQSDYANQVAQIEVQKTVQDFQDKMNALARAQTWLDNKRAYYAQLSMIETDRMNAQSQLDLAYARLAQEKELTTTQFSNTMEMFTKQFEFYKWQQTVPIYVNGKVQNIPLSQLINYQNAYYGTPGWSPNYGIGG